MYASFHAYGRSGEWNRRKKTHRKPYGRKVNNSIHAFMNLMNDEKIHQIWEFKKTNNNQITTITHGVCVCVCVYFGHDKFSFRKCKMIDDDDIMI